MARFSFLGTLALVIAVGFYGLFLGHKINLVTADLGRHIKNGETLLAEASVLRTNFYSYTQPDFPVVNHHWGSGLIFYLLWRAGGFALVQLLYIGLSVAAFWYSLRLTALKAGAGIAAVFSLGVVPLLAERTEVRPEVFTYLFAVLFLWLLARFRAGTLRARWLAAILAVLELLWVNTHIFFFFGLLIVGAFLLEALVTASARERLLPLAGVFGLTAAATLVNPFGLKGALAPFTILKNYGYRIAENQPVWFVEKLVANPNFFLFKVIFGLVVVSFVFVWLGRRFNFPTTLLALGVSALAWLQIRNFALFGFVALPLVGENMGAFLGSWLKRHEEEITRAALALVALVLVVFVAGRLQALFPYWREFGVGLESGTSQAAEFFKRENIVGPIFNNYDIGGYLIFHLFPREQVFVDNRPEAYSVDFLQKTYIPMQESEEKWREVDGRYQFNAIFFSHRDFTPWGQRFLITRIQDPEWAPVFADEYAIIFLKRNARNKSVIERYELPKEMFRIVNPAA